MTARRSQGHPQCMRHTIRFFPAFRVKQADSPLLTFATLAQADFHFFAVREAHLNRQECLCYAGRDSSAFVPASSVFRIASTSNTQPPQVPPLTFCSAAHNRVSSGN